MPTSTLIRTEALRAAGGFNADYAPAGDIALWMKLLAGSDLGWTPRPLSYLRIHDHHTHQWGNGPDAIQLKVWRDSVELPSSAVNAEAAQTAANNLSVPFTVYAIKSAMRGDFASARRSLAALNGHVGFVRAKVELLRALPRIFRERRAEKAARSDRRAVIYSPYSRVGGPLEDLVAAADAAKSDELKKAIGNPVD
jgi:hypothetical protein